MLGALLLSLVAQGNGADTLPCRFDTTGLQAQRIIAVGLAGGFRQARFGARQPVPQTYLLAAEAVRQHYRPPTKISLPFWAKTPTVRSVGDSLDTVGQGLDGILLFRLTETGQLADTNIVVATASPEFNASLVAAVRRADSASAFPLPEGDVRRDNGRILLRIVDFEHAAPPAVGLVRISVPVTRLDAQADYLTDPVIRYPEVSKEEGHNDDIVLQFVVNERGRADTASLRVLEGGHRELVLAALEALARTKFRPARIAGCAVPELVQVRYTFRTWIRCSVGTAC